MLSFINIKPKHFLRLGAILLLVVFSQPVWAAGPPEPSIFSNPLVVTFIILMVLLLIIIGILAYLLIGTADLKLRRTNKNEGTPATAVTTAILFFLLFGSTSLFAQDATAQAAPASNSIGGMAASTFYVMVSVIFLELIIIMVLLFNIRFLLKAEKKKLLATEEETLQAKTAKLNRLSWWDRFNKLRPVTQEAELDLGHEYDGIRELNNRLPPWWLYGFYATIIIGAIYLWRYHISHTGPSSEEEYKMEVARAEKKTQAYLKAKGENIDENTVTLLTAAEDIEAGRKIFSKGACIGCHGDDASGMVAGMPGAGPNLRDDYWIHGGNVKDIFKTIKYGVTGKMQPWASSYSAKEMAQIASYLKSLHGTKIEKGKEPQGELYKEESTKPAADSLRMLNDSIKAKDNKVAKN